jgi:alanyl-tRNA synthetase
MTSAEIRQSFLDFFASKQHAIVPSSPVVLPTDPTLLFTNAGMNQFKDIFLGNRESKDRRVANTQKCIRVSGKHNDLEEVGIDTYHHTFFEMLGNWSFGDYYKREAIAWAWELMTEVWKLPKDRLWATVYRDDDEAESLWKEVTDIEPSHILRFDEKDNFWEMGETGPCGPCSEIHIDLTENGCEADMVNAGSPEVIELWNLVFIQYNRQTDGSLVELPSKHVDTGMGFERVAAVLQGKKSNYDSDVFTPLLRKLQDMSGCAYEGEAAVAMRVIADHIRALSVAIADGVLPSNDGRGYVLRRLLRRAVRYGRKLHFTQPFMGELFPTLESVMGDVFPELRANRERVLRALQAEEESFATTLDRGLALFEDVAAKVTASGQRLFPGDSAFKLYDTYGFPLDLTTLMASERHLSVDQETFDALMEQQRERARQDRKSAAMEHDVEVVQALLKEGVRTTFVGYGRTEVETRALACLAGGAVKDTLTEGESGELVLAETVFYSESGGQVGDRGVIRGPHGEFEVWDTQRPAEGLVLHIGQVTQGVMKRGDAVAALVDTARRAHLELHHTATHLLNAALRELVSATVRQAGSLVAPDRLRFDFTHYEAVPAEKLEAIERRVNGWIMDDVGVKTYTMAYKDVPDSGIIAVFDEKYGDEVRVVDIGGFSRELCGGTHVQETGRLGFFRIVNESSVASGVRRIEAVCGWPAYEWTQREHELVRGLSQRFSVSPDELVKRVDQLVEHNRKLEKELKQKAASSSKELAVTLVDQVEQVGHTPVLAAVVDAMNMDALRGLLDHLRPKIPSGVIVLGSASEGKASFVAAVSDDHVAAGIHAGQLIGAIAKIAGGGGGGQPGKAQAGGKDPAKVPEAIAATKDLIRRMIESKAS